MNYTFDVHSRDQRAGHSKSQNSWPIQPPHYHTAWMQWVHWKYPQQQAGICLWHCCCLALCGSCQLLSVHKQSRWLSLCRIVKTGSTCTSTVHNSLEKNGEIVYVKKPKLQSWFVYIMYISIPIEWRWKVLVDVHVPMLRVYFMLILLTQGWTF